MKDFQPVSMNQWNFSIQRQIGQDWLLSASYLGNSTIHMISGEQQNPGVFIPGVGDANGNCTFNGQTVPFSVASGARCSTVTNTQSRRVLSLLNPAQGRFYSDIGTIDDGGTASYQGLFLSAQKRLSRGVSASANYTWSHCISDPYNQNPGAGGVAPPNNRRQWRSNCVGIDLRQQFVLNTVATTPQFSNRVLRLLGSHWQFAPILNIRSDTFFSVYAGTDRALTNVGNQSPNLVRLNPYPRHQTVDHWIDASAFAPAAPGTYGNLGRNNMKGPGVFQLDMALSRNFTFKEGQTIQLRAEAFNLPNHLNPFAPGAAPNAGQTGAFVNLIAPNFGQITNDISGTNGLTAGDYRVIQLALKLLF